MEFVFRPSPLVSTGDAQLNIELRDWDADGNRANSLAFFGWCACTTGLPLAVEFYLHSTLIATGPLDLHRGDVVEGPCWPELPLLCGFHLRISKFILPIGAELELWLWRQLKDGKDDRVLLGTITGLPRAEAATFYAERYQPLLLLGMGRSGTTYMMGLLGAHPEILAPGPHPFEMRQPVWLWQVAHVLSAPASRTSIGPDGFEANDPERLGHNPYRNRDWEKIAGAENTMRWQEEAFPIASIDFCKRQVDEFVARYSEGYPISPRYIAQKMLISPARYLVRNIYADAREIFLVRDFRDVWLSARRFNSQRGVASFGRDQFTDDLDWLRGLAFSARQIRFAYSHAGQGAQLVKYEELMRDPSLTLSRIFGWLGVDASSKRAQAVITEASGEQTSDVLAHRTSAADGSDGGWRVEMTPEEKAVASDAFGEALRYFGYEV